MKYTYLLVDFFTVLIPFLFSFHPKLNFYKNFKAFFIASLLAAVPFLIWDALFTRWGVWGFNSNYILGFKLFELPLEEILFFSCIPFACMFTYHCSALFYRFTWPKKLEQWFVMFCSISLLTIGLFHIQRAYTASACITTACFLLLLKFVFKVNWLSQILSIYPLLLIPFFIVNGILTGTGLEQPIVWYNNNENLGIRLGTIPIEDIVYGFELIVLNIFLYEQLKTKTEL